MTCNWHKVLLGQLRCVAALRVEGRHETEARLFFHLASSILCASPRFAMQAQEDEWRAQLRAREEEARRAAQQAAAAPAPAGRAPLAPHRVPAEEPMHDAIPDADDFEVRCQAGWRFEHTHKSAGNDRSHRSQRRVACCLPSFQPCVLTCSAAGCGEPAQHQQDDSGSGAQAGRCAMTPRHAEAAGLPQLTSYTSWTCPRGSMQQSPGRACDCSFYCACLPAATKQRQSTWADGTVARRECCTCPLFSNCR